MSVEVETHADGIVEVRLDHGPVNAMDIELCRAIADACTALNAEPEVRAVVLTSAAKAFGAGVDLPAMLDGGQPYVLEFLDALTACFTAVHDLPSPTVAAATGHAIAGGAILAGACDRVVATDDRARFGLTELQVGVPFPTVGIEIMRARLAPQRFAEVVLHGRLYGPDDARALGFVDEVVPADEVVDRAFAVARELAAVPRSTYRITKAQLQRPVRDAVAARQGEWDPQVDAGWVSDEVRDAMRAFTEATLRR